MKYEDMVGNLEKVRSELKNGEFSRELVLDYIDTIFNISIANRKEIEEEHVEDRNYYDADRQRTMRDAELGFKCQLLVDIRTDKKEDN